MRAVVNHSGKSSGLSIALLNAVASASWDAVSCFSQKFGIASTPPISNYLIF